MLDLIALREGQASSAIENLVTTQDELHRAIAAGQLFLDRPSDTQEGSTVKEVLRYREAMYKGWESLQARPIINTTLCTEVVRAIKNVRNLDVRTQAATHIATDAGAIIYTLPSGEPLLRDMLHQWGDYLNGGYEVHEHDPIVAMALAHYQFEAIHPYPDGNGRTGRIVNVLHLINADLIEQPILYLSQYINQNRSAYYRGLRAVTERQAWLPWVRYRTQAVATTARQTIADIRAINALMQEALIEIRVTLGDGVPAERICDLMFQQAYLKIELLERAGIAKRQTASKYLYALTNRDGGPDLLRPERVGREVYFRNHRLLEVLGRGDK